MQSTDLRTEVSGNRIGATLMQQALPDMRSHDDCYAGTVTEVWGLLYAGRHVHLIISCTIRFSQDKSVQMNSFDAFNLCRNL